MTFRVRACDASSSITSGLLARLGAGILVTSAAMLWMEQDVTSLGLLRDVSGQACKYLTLNIPHRYCRTTLTYRFLIVAVLETLRLALRACSIRCTRRNLQACRTRAAPTLPACKINAAPVSSDRAEHLSLRLLDNSSYRMPRTALPTRRRTSRNPSHVAPAPAPPQCSTAT